MPAKHGFRARLSGKGTKITGKTIHGTNPNTRSQSGYLKGSGKSKYAKKKANQEAELRRGQYRGVG